LPAAAAEHLAQDVAHSAAAALRPATAQHLPENVAEPAATAGRLPAAAAIGEHREDDREERHHDAAHAAAARLGRRLPRAAAHVLIAETTLAAHTGRARRRTREKIFQNAHMTSEAVTGRAAPVPLGR
jgi:hypothetical protein